MDYSPMFREKILVHLEMLPVARGEDNLLSFLSISRVPDNLLIGALGRVVVACFPLLRGGGGIGRAGHGGSGC